MKRLLIFLALLISAPVYAQTPVRPCYATGGINCIPGIQASASVAISQASAATVQIVALASGQKIYVTSFNVMSAGTGNFSLVYGTGTNCGTGTTALTGAYPLIAQSGISTGNGLGTILFVPSGNALCVTSSAAVQMSGSLSYVQF